MVRNETYASTGVVFTMQPGKGGVRRGAHECMYECKRDTWPTDVFRV